MIPQEAILAIMVFITLIYGFFLINLNERIKRLKEELTNERMNRLKKELIKQ